MSHNNKHFSLIENPTVRILFVFCIGMLLFAGLFSLLEKDVSYFDALYWVVTTCSTVGYGDLSPTNTVSKIITMFLMISGVALLGYLLSTISDKLVSINMGKIMGLNRCRAEGHTIIAGWNPVAKIALEELLSLGIEAVVIDRESRPEISTYNKTSFVLGNHDNPDILIKAGIKKAENIILSMESDSEVILAITNIRSLNNDIKIIGRIDDLDFSDVAEKAGCDRVVSPSEIGGNLLFSALSEPSVARWVMDSTIANIGIELSDIKVSSTAYAGKPVSEITIGDGNQIVGVDKPSKGTILTLPEANVTLDSSDTLIVLSHCEKNNSINTYYTLSQGKIDGNVLFIGWNPAVRSAVDEFIDNRNYTLSVLTNEISKSESEYYSNNGITFIHKDINKLTLGTIIDSSVKNIIIGIEDDAEAILVSHIVKGMAPDATIVLRVDDPANRDAAIRSGAGQLISPSAIGGRLLAHAITRPSSVKWIMEITTSRVGANINELLVTESHTFCNKKVKDLTFDTPSLVLGIDKGTDTILDTVVLDDYVIHAGDTIVFVER